MRSCVLQGTHNGIQLHQLLGPCYPVALCSAVRLQLFPRGLDFVVPLVVQPLCELDCRSGVAVLHHALIIAAVASSVNLCYERLQFVPNPLLVKRPGAQGTTHVLENTPNQLRHACLLRLLKVHRDDARGFVNAGILGDHTGLQQVKAEVTAVLQPILLFHAGVNKGAKIHFRFFVVHVELLLQCCYYAAVGSLRQALLHLLTS